MPKFARQNFKGELTIKGVEQELYSLLNSYTPSTLMVDELDKFTATLKPICTDYEKFEGSSFKKELGRITKRLQERNPTYVTPVL